MIYDVYGSAVSVAYDVDGDSAAVVGIQVVRNKIAVHVFSSRIV